MNALTRPLAIPVPYFEPATPDALSLLVNLFKPRQTSFDGLMALCVVLDRTLASDPDEATRERLQTVADALDVSIDTGFCAGVRLNLDQIADQWLTENSTYQLRGEHSFEAPTASTWQVREDAADRMLEAARDAMTGDAA